jgi:hypothetical protein
MSDVFVIRVYGSSNMIDKKGECYDHYVFWVGSDLLFLDHIYEKNQIMFRRELFENLSTDCKLNMKLQFIGKTKYLPEQLLSIGQKLLIEFDNKYESKTNIKKISNPKILENTHKFWKIFLEQTLNEKPKINLETYELDFCLRKSSKIKSESSKSCIIC